MSTKIRLKKEIQHKLGNQSLNAPTDPPASVVSPSFLHKTVHAAGHDLRSPLFVIRAYSQLLKRTQEKKVLEQGLELMDEATGKMEKTINEFVGLIDIYTQPFPAKTSVSLENAFETAQFQLVCLIQDHQPNISYDFTECLSVHFNEKYLINIFTYLLDNAIRHNTGKEDLEIMVSSKIVNNDVIITVQDNGKGIEDDLDKVKNAFYSYTQEEQPECVGMGLAKIHAIAQVSQNSFSLESKPGITKGIFTFKG